MKTFNQFRKDIDEAAALVTALPKIVSVASKVAPKLPKIAKFASGALKFGTAVPVQVPLGLGVAKVLQSKKISDMSDDEIEKSGTIDPLNLGKNPQSKRQKLKNVVGQISKEIKDAGKQVRKGLSVKPEEVKGKKYRTDDMKKGETPVQYLNRKFRKQIEKQKEQYKRERERNKRNELP